MPIQRGLCNESQYIQTTEQIQWVRSRRRPRMCVWQGVLGVHVGRKQDVPRDAIHNKNEISPKFRWGSIGKQDQGVSELSFATHILLFTIF